jgi:hypothetical protein
MTGLDLSLGEIAVFVLAVAASGVVSGLMAGVFGIGGGAVLVPVFYQVFGLLGVEDAVRMHLSVGSSLAIIIPTSLRSFTSHRARGTVDMELLRSFYVPVPAGVLLASLTAAYLTSEGLRIIFAVITLVVALRLLFNRESWRIGTTIPGNPARGVIGVAIGYFSTLMGIGGGVMNNTFMTLYGRRRRHDRDSRHARLCLGRLGRAGPAPGLHRLRQLDRGRDHHPDRASGHAMGRATGACPVAAPARNLLRPVLRLRLGAVLLEPRIEAT